MCRSIQLAIRLLVTEGSRLLELPEIRGVIREFNPRSLSYPWAHADARVDDLQKQIEAFVGGNLSGPAGRYSAASGRSRTRQPALQAARRVDPDGPARATIPHLSEPWYCCAEPTSEQVALI